MSDPKAALRASFAALSPVDWSDVPKDNLAAFLKDVFAHAEELTNSIPLPESSETSFPGVSTSQKANAAAETAVDPHETALDKRHEHLKKAWGKPINKPNTKDNPLHVYMYKAAAYDKRGAWFARRSIHKGLPFSTWKKAMRREFLTSLKVKKGPGSGAVRGLAGDQRLEREVIDEAGNVEVWLLSSAFPGPVSPRDFVTLLLTSDNALTEESIPLGSSEKTPPRHFMVVSKPVVHPGAGEREGLVRGFYESVEMAREIPGTGDDPESNLVEWMMITRSDPGGGIPRFMVERGTPGSIVADVPRWLDWAISKGPSLDDADEESAEEELKELNANQTDPAASEPNLHRPAATSLEVGESLTRSVTDHGQPLRPKEIHEPDESHGYSSLLGNLTTAVGSTVAGYLPMFKSTDLERHASVISNTDEEEEEGEESDESDTSSDEGTFASAGEGDGKIQVVSPHSNSTSDTRSLGSTELGVDGNPKPLNQHEKELIKLQQKRQALDEKMAKVREDEVRKTKEVGEKEETELKKMQEKNERERRRQEERYAKYMRRLEEKRKKEEKKAEEARLKEEKRVEERMKKARENNALLKAQTERDGFRERLHVTEKERDVLQMQVEELQRENTLLVQKLGAGESGIDIVRKVKLEALSRSRASSRASRTSGKSGHRPMASTEKLVGDHE